MRKSIYLLLAMVVLLGMTGCVKKPRHKSTNKRVVHKPVPVKAAEPIPLLAQKLEYDFGYPATEAIPTLNLDNVQMRSGEMIFSNSGEMNLSIKSVVPQDPISKNFKMHTKCQNILKMDEKCKVYVDFTGKEAGVFTQTYLVTSNDPSQSKLVLKAEAIAIEKITITNFSISNNVKDFLEDKSATNRDYYTRYVFQNYLDDNLRSSVKSEFESLLKKNDYTKNSSAFKSSKSITLYPSIEVISTGENQYKIKIAMNGTIATKSHRNNKAMPHNTDYATYDMIENSDIVFDKEKFAFFIEVNAIDQKDKKALYQSISKIVATATVSVLGLEK